MQKLSGAALGALGAVLSPQATAQAVQTPAEMAPTSSEASLDEIIVTAQKRESRIERTSVALSVVSGEAIADQGIREIKQLNATIPGMTMNESPGGLTEIGIRGVSTSAANQLFEQSVGLFIDGIYHPRQRQYRDGLFDVERIEVIKGSQGVLFGKNTSVGALSIISRRPGNTLEGYVAGDYEARYNSFSTEGAIDLPVSDTLKVRVSGLYTDTKGYVHNVTLDRNEERAERWLVRGMIDWDPAEGVNVLLKLQASELDITGSNFEYLESGNPSALRALGVADGSARDFVKYASSAPSGDEGDHQRTFDPSLNINLEIGDHVLTSTTGYSSFDYSNGFDLDGTPQPSYYNFFRERFRQFTQELRIASPGGGRIEYIAGLFFLSQRDTFNFDSLYRDFQVPNLTGYESQQTRQRETDIAGFGQFTWRPSERVRFDIGARVSNTRKTGTYVKTIPSLLGNANSILPFVIKPGTISGKIDRTNVDGNATISFLPNTRSTIYVSVGRGTKASAFNNTSPLLGVVPTPFIVPDEIATTYEIGAKTRFADGRGLIAVAAYYLDIEGYQDSYFDGTQIGFLVRSLPATSAGIEAEGQYQATPWLNFYGNIGWNPEARLRLPTGVRERLQRAAKFTGVAGARVSSDVGSTLHLDGFLQLQHSSGFFHQPPGSGGEVFSGSYDLIDARVAITHLPTNLELSLRIENITNARYYAFSFLSPSEPTSTMGYFNRPRTFTIGGKVKF